MSGAAGVVMGILVTLLVKKLSETTTQEKHSKRPELLVEPQISVPAANTIKEEIVPFPDEVSWSDPIPHNDIWHVCSSACSEFIGNRTPRSQGRNRGKRPHRPSKWEKW